MTISLVILRTLALGHQLPQFTSDENPVAAHPDPLTRVRASYCLRRAFEQTKNREKNLKMSLLLRFTDAYLLLHPRHTLLVANLSGLAVLRLVTQFDNICRRLPRWPPVFHRCHVYIPAAVILHRHKVSIEFFFLKSESS